MSNIIVSLAILVLIVVAGWWIYSYHQEWIPDFMLDFINGLFVRDNRIQITFQTNLNTIPDDFAIPEGLWSQNTDDDCMFFITCVQDIAECGVFITYDDGKVDDIYIKGSGKSSVEILSNGKGQEFHIEVGVESYGVKVYTKMVNCGTMGVKAFTPAELRTLPKKIDIYWVPDKDKKYNMRVVGRPIVGGGTKTFYDKNDVSKGIIRKYFLDQYTLN